MRELPGILWRWLFHLKAWDRRQVIRERGLRGWLAHEWGFIRFLSQDLRGQIAFREDEIRALAETLGTSRQ